ncbi:MAG: prenyltransferase [Hyphomicrobiaceae bacterium]
MSEPSRKIYHATTTANRLATWLAATRPAFLQVSVLPVLVSGTLADWHSEPDWRALLLAACTSAIVMVHAGANVLNDYFDAANGTDTVNSARIYPFTGGSRFIQNGVLSPLATMWLGASLLATGCLIGLSLLATAPLALLPIGVIGVALAIIYTAPPCLVCRGLGDLVIAASFGILPVVGATLILTGHIPVEAWWIGAGLGAFAAAILWINAIPDIPADLAAGKKTLPARLGAERSARLLSVWFVAGFASLLAAPLPASTWLVLAAAIPAGMASRAARDGRLRAAVTLTIATHAVVALLLIVGLLAAR